ncbi:hypothetical protein CHS0354_006196 [Potamilus streckersoni]|uniref:Ribosome-binding factor A, mitochondrial n=1 Tax=Potamilus streckersoni TaxID=2493646 RepID=A0AAE0SR20_9BIVA|nr:hypothetical protein CHS0354_006196 [Potamilus streckersoni]
MATSLQLYCYQSRVCFIARQLGYLRRLHATTILNQKYFRASKLSTLEKMIYRGAKEKKKIWYNVPAPNVAGIIPKERKISTGSIRRAVHVSHVLYNYITEIINSGELDPKLVDGKIMISQVKVVPDFSSVNVYWLVSGSEEDQEIEQLLKQRAGKLRHLLTTYHTLGIVPPVTFVCDRSLINIREVERLLKIADYGSDENLEEIEEIPPKVTSERKIAQLHLLGQEFSENWADFNTLDTRTEVTYLGGRCTLKTDSSKLKINDLIESNQVAEKVNPQNENIPSDSVGRKTVSLEHSTNSYDVKSNSSAEVKINFRQDLYGLHHDLIMNKIVAAKQKSARQKLDAAEPLTLSTEQETRKPVTSMYSKNTERIDKKDMRHLAFLERDIVLKGLNAKSSDDIQPYTSQKELDYYSDDYSDNNYGSDDDDNYDDDDDNGRQ